MVGRGRERRNSGGEKKEKREGSGKERGRQSLPFFFLAPSGRLPATFSFTIYNSLILAFAHVYALQQERT